MNEKYVDEERYKKFKDMLDKEYDKKFRELFEHLSIEDFDNAGIQPMDFPNVDGKKLVKMLQDVRDRKETEYMNKHGGMPHAYLNDIRTGRVKIEG